MKRILQLLLLICLFFQFDMLLAEKAPDWVTNRPINREFYIGIGYASKIKGSNEHIEIAKNGALKNLASEITVNITGEVISNVVEKSGLLEEELRSLIRSTTEAELEGYELVDEWQDKKEYWVYYRLSKIIYIKLRQENIDQAISLALNLFSEAKKNEISKNYEKALLYYLQALNPIEKYITETLQTEFDGRTIYLNNEIYFSIQNLLSNIELEPAKTSVEAKRNKALKQPLVVKAIYYEAEQTPISNLPLSFAFTRGDGDLIKNIRTNMNGEAKCKVSKITSNDRMQMVGVELDISSLINQDSTSFVYQNILKSFPIPTTRIILNVTGLSFNIESDETNLGKKLSVLHVEPKLKEAFSEKGFTFTEDMSKADVYVKINARSREGSELYGMFTAFVDLSVSAIDMSSGDEVYKCSLTNVSGQGLNFEKAGLKAFENAADEISEDMLPVLMKMLE
ncbi:MAG: LPP20 family lipoprotein [Candidatus Cloacimonetes bacterium]|nr:LPP20 family lipoprotein [Candidatus Cloacimonadota bacterium]MBL7149933.1 LPP20 family lipoprotein [Candidatus Cloacimonadota bacterium]